MATPGWLSEGTVGVPAGAQRLALVAYALATGRPPFDPALTPRPLMQQIMGGTRPELPEMPAPLADLITRAWDVETAVRPSAAEFFQVLAENNFAIVPGVDVSAVRKYCARFGPGPQPGESEEEALARANAQAREDLAKAKAELAALTLLAAEQRDENARLQKEYAGLSRTVRLLNKRLYDLEAVVAALKEE
jgi:hypothetical protein